MGKHKIRWRESDIEKINKAVRAFNSKIKRNSDKPIIQDILPAPVKAKDLRMNITTRQELNRELNKLKRFMKRDALKLINNEFGVVATKYDVRETKIDIQTINRQRTIERKRALSTPAKSRGQDLGMTRGEMDNKRTSQLTHKKVNFGSFKTNSQWDKFKDEVNKDLYYSHLGDQLDLYKENYIKSIRTVFGSYADDIIDIISKLPPRTVVDTYYSDEQADIDFIYYDPEEMESKHDILLELWNDVLHC